MPTDILRSVSTLPRRPEPPSSLPAAGKALWRSITKQYDPGHFTGANLLLLEQLAKAHCFALACERNVKRRGIIVDNKANPAVAMRNAAWAEIRACCTKLRISISGTMRAEHAGARPDPKHSLRKPWDEQ